MGSGFSDRTRKIFIEQVFASVGNVLKAIYLGVFIKCEILSSRKRYVMPLRNESWKHSLHYSI